VVSDVIQGMRNRVEQCRRLASMINHPEAREILLKMAREGEADIERLLAEQNAQQMPDPGKARS
jgi:hypothetical protein